MRWFGPEFSLPYDEGGAAVSVAAANWQAHLLAALSEMGVSVAVTTFHPVRAWPAGPLLPRVGPAGIGRSSGEIGKRVRVVNVPGVRWHCLNRAFQADLVRSLRRGTEPCPPLITYNLHRAYSSTARAAAGQGRVRWIPVIADVEREGAAVAGLESELSAAAGAIVLSWGLAEKLGHSLPVLHLDGGCAPFDERREELPGRPSVLYAGSLGPYGGVETLLEAAKLIGLRSIRVVVCGQGDAGRLREAFGSDPRIEILGLVSPEQMAQECRRASVLVNPRPRGLQASQDNFPSKLLNYVRYGKPVVSSRTEGVSPSWREVLTYTKDDSREELARTIEQVLAWGPAEREAQAAACRRFATGHSWRIQAERLVRWVTSSSRRGADGAAL